MFNWDEFKKGKISVWCKTEEIAKNFLEECYKHDIKWNWREKTSNKTYWDAAKYNTCYFYELEYSMSLAWGSKQYAESEHYTIVDWSKEIESNGLLTYREIIANIKEGEMYTCEDKNCLISNIELKNGQLKEIINLKGSDYILIDKPMFRLKEQTDWSKVPQGTMILVKNNEEDGWVEREFIAYARYSICPFVTYDLYKHNIKIWEYAKLKR